MLYFRRQTASILTFLRKRGNNTGEITASISILFYCSGECRKSFPVAQNNYLWQTPVYSIGLAFQEWDFLCSLLRNIPNFCSWRQVGPAKIVDVGLWWKVIVFVKTEDRLSSREVRFKSSEIPFNTFSVYI